MVSSSGSEFMAPGSQHVNPDPGTLNQNQKPGTMNAEPHRLD